MPSFSIFVRLALASVTLAALTSATPTPSVAAQGLVLPGLPIIPSIDVNIGTPSTCPPVTLPNILKATTDVKLGGVIHLVDSLVATHADLDKAVLQTVVIALGGGVSDALNLVKSLLLVKSSVSPQDSAAALIQFLDIVHGVLSDVIVDLAPLNAGIHLDADLGPVVNAVANSLTSLLTTIFTERPDILAAVNAQLGVQLPVVVKSWASLGLGLEKVAIVLGGKISL
ncbi:hypothetical protein H0H87_011604 [Tephrocybe sp. NHM501043]|nr:hypothetical protein H0H87_011604 [Tephrocybe sp. NHM501043]